MEENSVSAIINFFNNIGLWLKTLRVEDGELFSAKYSIEKVIRRGLNKEFNSSKYFKLFLGLFCRVFHSTVAGIK